MPQVGGSIPPREFNKVPFSFLNISSHAQGFMLWAIDANSRKDDFMISEQLEILEQAEERREELLNVNAELKNDFYAMIARALTELIKKVGGTL